MCLEQFLFTACYHYFHKEGEAVSYVCCLVGGLFVCLGVFLALVFVWIFFVLWELFSDEGMFVFKS